MKNREEVEKFLEGYIDDMGFISINQAAQYISDNYKDYDYQGSDAAFIAHCEDIAAQEPGHKLTKYTGLIEHYHETGMECLGFIFHDDRGNYEGPTHNGSGETMTYRSLAWTLWFHKRCLHFARIFDKKGKMVYEGKLTRDRAKIAKHKYRYSFLPEEIPEDDWVGYCLKEYRAELWTNEIPHAIKEKLGENLLPFDVGQRVWDDLTGQKEVVVNITYKLHDDESGGTVGYWLSNDYLKGGRHPWEISALSMEQIMDED